MLILSATTDKIQVVLGGNVTTNQLKCYASYNDTTTTSITPGRNATLTNNTTAVDLVASPSSSTQRVISYLSVYNSDTASATVNVNLVSSSTSYSVFITTLSTGEKLEYQQGEGFRVLAPDGSLKIVPNASGIPASSNVNFTALAGDVATTSTSLSDVTGLSLSVSSGKTYWFRFIIAATSPGTAVGWGWSINGPSFSYLAYHSYYPSSTTTLLYNNGVSTYDTPSTSTTNNVVTPGMIFIEGLITPSADGTLIARFRSESAGSAITAKAGSVVFYQQMN
jgi:hypothetical protein